MFRLALSIDQIPLHNVRLSSFVESDLNRNSNCDIVLFASRKLGTFHGATFRRSTIEKIEPNFVCLFVCLLSIEGNRFWIFCWFSFIYSVNGQWSLRIHSCAFVCARHHTCLLKYIFKSRENKYRNDSRVRGERCNKAVKRETAANELGYELSELTLLCETTAKQWSSILLLFYSTRARDVCSFTVFVRWNEK